MSTGPDALDVVAAFGTAWAAHDLDATPALMHEDCLFDATGPAPDGAEHRGKAQVRAAWQTIFGDRDATFEVEETIAMGTSHVVQRWRYDWGDGHVRGIDLFEVHDGLVAAKRSYVKG